jgi:hypothetical protein
VSSGPSVSAARDAGGFGGRAQPPSTGTIAPETKHPALEAGIDDTGEDGLILPALLDDHAASRLAEVLPLMEDDLRQLDGHAECLIGYKRMIVFGFVR